ncbi:VC2046/SO_2500 family protein [Vibrio sp. HN007]|uniref:VC2046/SO_2500 family protein n=1 Tax=Vibrio iocasae TaxID=3098914 RepID=UPI0035D407B8
MQVQEAIADIQINELNFGSQINNAVELGNRSDFALLLAMLSGDAREIEPIEYLDTTVDSENDIRIRLGVNPSQPLSSSKETYSKGAAISHNFHSGGIESARLQNGLCPDALAYVAENTQGLGEDVYRNLSEREQKLAANKPISPMDTNDLYHKLVVANRTSQINAQV